MQSIVIISVILLSVIALNVVAPKTDDFEAIFFWRLSNSKLASFVNKQVVDALPGRPPLE